MHRIFKLGVAAAVSTAVLTAGSTVAYAALPNGATPVWTDASNFAGGGTTFTTFWEKYNEPNIIPYWLDDELKTGSVDCSSATDPSAAARIDYSPTETGARSTFANLTVEVHPVFGESTVWAVPVVLPAGYYWMQLVVNGNDVPQCFTGFTTVAQENVAPNNMTITADRAHDAAGVWYRSPITVRGSSDDPSAVCTDATYSGPDIALTFLTVKCSDRPWHNVANSAPWIFGYDATPPTMTTQSLITDGASYPLGSVPPIPGCTSQDALSGPDGCTTSGYGTAVGPHTIDFTARDIAGNVTVSHISYTVTPLGGDKAELSVTGGSVREGTRTGGRLVFTIHLSKASTQKVSVYVKTRGVTANRLDFEPVAKRVTFLPGQVSRIVAVQITPDAIYERNEIVALALSAPIGDAVLATTPGAIGTILNDD